MKQRTRTAGHAVKELYALNKQIEEREQKILNCTNEIIARNPYIGFGMINICVELSLGEDVNMDCLYQKKKELEEEIVLLQQHQVFA
jgi:hypothetical protein